MEKKVCSKCKIEKDISNFRKDKTKPDGLYSSCIACKSEYNKSRNFKINKNKKYKICSKCKIKKEVIGFAKCKRIFDGYNNMCKDCVHSHKQKPDIKNKFNEYMKNKRQNDPYYKISNSLRCRIRSAISNGYKSKSTQELVGCSIDFLKSYLEDKFQDGMDWGNYGKWHIDHVRPCSSFDLTDTKQQEQCFHYTNLQPLWATENLQKGSKWGNIILE